MYELELTDKIDRKNRKTIALNPNKKSEATVRG